MNDKISPQEIIRFIKGKNDLTDIKVYDCLKSTNDTAKEMARSGVKHTTVIIADRQTEGRGRYGHTFFSPQGGIYMSILMRSEMLSFDVPETITAFAAVTVCNAIEELTDKKPRIKWVNDIFLNNKKICGILTEMVSGYVVIGIGINFSTPECGFPEEIRQTAGSLFPDGNPQTTRNRLIAGIIDKIVMSDEYKDTVIISDEYLKRKKT